MRVLVINCGSATLKYKLFEDRNTGLELLAAAVVETTVGIVPLWGKSWRSCPRRRTSSPIEWCTAAGACPIWSGSTAGCSASCAS